MIDRFKKKQRKNNCHHLSNFDRCADIGILRCSGAVLEKAACMHKENVKEYSEGLAPKHSI